MCLLCSVCPIHKKMKPSSSLPTKTWRQELEEIKSTDKVSFPMILRILRGLAEDTLKKER